jgi:phospholipid/cholesterol/gamma-HCH transport system permease protein
MLVSLFQPIGQAVLEFMEACGGVVFLLADTIRSIFRYKLRWNLLLQQMYLLGMKSIPVILVTGAFMGAAFAAQTFFYFSTLGLASAVGPTVAVSMCREFAPVVGALMLSGRVGTAMAAELSTMKITEQIDALRALAVYPNEYLIVPRFLAMMISMPLLTGMAIVCGIGAGYIVAVPLFGVDPVYYWDNTLKFTTLDDVAFGLMKSLIFSVLICMISCYKGLNAGYGAEGVGRATTQAMVVSSLSILIFNFFLSMLFNQLFPRP